MPLTESVLVVLGVPELLGVVDALAPTVIDGVGESEGDALRVSVEESMFCEDDAPLIDADETRLAVIDPVCVDVGVGVADEVPVNDAVSLPDTLLVSEPVPEELGVIEADAPRVRGGVCVFEIDALSVVVDDGVDDEVCVSVDVPDTVAVCDGVGSAVRVAEIVTVDVADGVCDDDGVALAEPPADSVVVGVAVNVDERLVDVEPVSLPDGERVGVTAAVPVPDLEGVAVPVGVAESEGVVEPVPESEPVFDELAPVVSEAVGERDTDFEALLVELGVTDDVPVPEFVGVLVGVTLPVLLTVMLAVLEILGVSLALAPSVTEGVAEIDVDAVSDGVVDGVNEGVPVPVAVSEPVAD